MKFLKPCPGCQQFFSPPESVPPDSGLQCPACGVRVALSDIVAEESSTIGTWGVVPILLPEESFSAEEAVELKPLREFDTVVEDNVSFEKPLTPSNETVGGINLTESPFDSDSVESSPPFHAFDEPSTFASDPTLRPASSDLASIALAASGDPDTFDERSSSESVSAESDKTMTAEATIEEIPFGFDAMESDSFESDEIGADSKPHVAIDESSFDRSSDDISRSAEPEPTDPWATALFESTSPNGPSTGTEEDDPKPIATEVDAHAAGSQDDEIELVDHDEFDLDSETILPSEGNVESIDGISEVSEPVAAIKPEPVQAVTSSAVKRKIEPELLADNAIRRRRRTGSSFGTLLSVVGGGVAAIPISIALMWYFLGKDPFELGPVVSVYAPWMVPTEFQGNLGFQAQDFPAMPDFGPSTSNDLSSTTSDPAISSDSPVVDGNNSLPGFAPEENAVASDSSPANPLTAAPPNLPPIEQPAIPDAVSENILDSSIFELPSAKTIEETKNKAEASGELASASISEDVKPEVPIVPLNNPTALSTAPSKDGKPASDSNNEALYSSADEELRNQLSRIEESFVAIDDNSLGTESLVNDIEKFGRLLATIPIESDRFAIWHNRIAPLMAGMLEDAKRILPYFKIEVARNNDTVSVPGWIGSDLVIVQKIESEDGLSSWTIGDCFRKEILKLAVVSPILVSDNVEAGKAGERYWILGVTELDEATQERRFRVLSAAKMVAASAAR